MRPGHVSRILSRGFRLRCPLCGQGKLFSGFFRMHPTCRVCGLKFERDVGYFVGGVELHWIVTYVAGILGYVAVQHLVPLREEALLAIYMPLMLGASILFYRL